MYVCMLGGGHRSDQTRTPSLIWAQWQQTNGKTKGSKTPDHAGIYVVSDFNLFSKDLQSSDKFILGRWLMLWLVRHWCEWLQLSCCSVQFCSMCCILRLLWRKEDKLPLDFLILYMLQGTGPLANIWDSAVKCIKYKIRESHFLTLTLTIHVHSLNLLNKVWHYKESTVLPSQRVGVSKHTHEVEGISAVRVWLMPQMSGRNHC